MSVPELLEHAARHQITRLALTDHDTLQGLAEARILSAHFGIELIPGIEISASWEKHGVHIVGLDIDNESDELDQLLAEIQIIRQQRSLDIAERLQARGIGDAWTRTREIAGHERITRTHFARMLVAAGHCKNSKQAFKRYLAQGQSAFVRTPWPSLERVVQTIHEAGGLAVLAHPLSYKISARQRRELMACFTEAGGDALEVSAGSAQNPQQIELAAELARDFSLMASQGSDLHAVEQRWLRFGALAPLPADLNPVWSAFGQGRQMPVA